MSDKLSRRRFLGAAIGGTLTAAAGRRLCVFAAAPDADRVARLLAKVSGMPPSEICFARARLMTESYRQTAGQPAILRRAKAFLAIAEGMPVCIGDDELVVGNISSKPRVAYFAPETFYWGQYRPGKELVLSDHRLSKDLAIRFTVPDDIAAFWREQPRGDTAGHFVADYAKVLRVGVAGLRAESERHRRRHEQAGTLDTPRKNFYEAVALTCHAAERFAQRYAEEALRLARTTTDPLRRAELEQIAEICQRVPAQPARTFREAIQAFWFTHVLIHLNSSEWSISPGRFDQYMGAYYEQDISQGRLTRQQAGDLLACLWIKFNEVRVGAIDFINYQNLIIGGVNATGRDATNDLSYLCLETTARLRTLSQPSLSLRWHPGTPSRLLEEACRLALTGSGRPALFNDGAIIPALVEAGVAEDDAKNYAIAGCEELAVPGKLYGVMRAGDTNQAQCVLAALKGNPQSFLELLALYKSALVAETRQAMARSNDRDRRNAEQTPHPFVSLLFDNCLRDGRDITAGGAAYNITSMSEAGTITAANSLLAVKKAVFEDRRMSLDELRAALAANFEGHARLRAYLRHAAPKFGNDNDEADSFARDMARLNHQVIQEIGAHDHRGGRFATGSGGATTWLRGTHTGATPDGRLRGEALSISLGPAAGDDRLGPTAMLNSVAKLIWREQAGGALTHLRLPYSPHHTSSAIANLAALIVTFFRQGGMGLHITATDAQTLRRALENPEQYLGLLVRVGGFSAPFVLLSPEIQRNIIERTEHQL